MRHTWRLAGRADRRYAGHRVRLGARGRRREPAQREHAGGEPAMDRVALIDLPVTSHGVRAAVAGRPTAAGSPRGRACRDRRRHTVARHCGSPTAPLAPARLSLASISIQEWSLGMKLRGWTFNPSRTVLHQQRRMDPRRCQDPQKPPWPSPSRGAARYPP